MSTPVMSSSMGKHMYADVGSSSMPPPVVTDEEEKLSDYDVGGYHHVQIGDVLGLNGRYRIVRKLGWGHFSTVWLAHDQHENRHVALKVVKSAVHYTETALDEIRLLERVARGNEDFPDSKHPGRDHVVTLYDHFTHRGPNGSHVCMVFEVLGENLLGLIKRYQHRGVPEHICKQIARQVLVGLDYLHRECGIIHTDLKPENVLICIEDVEAVVRAEMASSPSAVPTKLVGVPPSSGRGGQQTPRPDPICITGSQPLQSPSSLGFSPVIEKLGFQMTRISDSSQMHPMSYAGPSTHSGTAPHPSENPGSSGFDIISQSVPATSHMQGNKPSLLSQQAAAGAAATTPSQDIAGQGSSSAQDASSSPTTFPSSASIETPTSEDPPNGTAHSLDSAPSSSLGSAGTPASPYDPRSLQRIRVKIADLGNASWVDVHFTDDIQTRQYRSPEAILGARWGPPVDVWSAAAMFFEMITGDYLFDPHPGKWYNKDDDHIAQIIELLGPFPPEVSSSGRFSNEIFDRRGQLRHIHRLKFWALPSVLTEKYMISEHDAASISSFLIPMLNVNPTQRATALEIVQHEWLREDALDDSFDTLVAQVRDAYSTLKQRQHERRAPLSVHTGAGLRHTPDVEPSDDRMDEDTPEQLPPAAAAAAAGLDYSPHSWASKSAASPPNITNVNASFTRFEQAARNTPP